LRVIAVNVARWSGGRPKRDVRGDQVTVAAIIGGSARRAL
jgi:hypothetical protein